ncbi:MAG: tetratricopeptide repeat protein [Planctomycetia bacterium]|nr:tetratricopeptide repeat protein [Planctomycetia bacterium]
MHLRLTALAFCAVVAFAPPVFSADPVTDNTIIEKASDSPPQVTEARGKADSAYQQGNYAKVVELATWLIDNHPGDNVHVAYHLRASAKIEQGRRAGSGKQVREGIADARQAIILAGNEHPWVHIPYVYGLSSLAEIERRKEHADLAIKVVTPVLSFPETKNFTADHRANLYYQRGLAYASRGDLKLAANDQAEAIRLSPQHISAHLKRAEALTAQGLVKDALVAYDKAVEAFPNVLVVFNDRGKLRRTAGDLDGAISDFERCLQLDQKFAVGYVNRGMCLAESNNPQAAEGDFSDALKLKPDPATSAFALRLRATARLAQGKAPEAITDLDTLIKSNPRDASAYEDRGFAQYFQKKFSAALADFTKAVELNPQAGHLVPWRALALARSGMTAEARALVEATLAAKTPPTGWIAKVCAYLLDQATEQELLDTAAAAPSAREKSRLACEARYFAGQKHLVHEDADKAGELFREIIASKEYALSAYRGACYELGQFGN